MDVHEAKDIVGANAGASMQSKAGAKDAELDKEGAFVEEEIIGEQLINITTTYNIDNDGEETSDKKGLCVQEGG